MDRASATLGGMDPRATPRDTVFAVLLAATCGIADAVGYVSSGIFAANMTGNTVLVGLALAGQDWLLAGERALTLVTFFAGAMLGRRLAAKARPWAPLLVEAVLVGLAALPWPGVMAPLWIVALAMGVQASAFTGFRGVAVSTIVITSSIAHLAEDAQDRLRGSPPPASGGLLALIWVAYGAGAVLAGILLQAVRFPLAVPAAILLVLTAWSLRR
ncbi:MAG: YoaK family protein [Casimicrobiaceae bacterium]